MRQTTCAAIVLALSPSLACFADDDPFRVHVFTRTSGFRHGSIDVGVKTLQELGEANGFEVVHANAPAFFTDDDLATFDVVVFLNTTQTVLEEDAKAAFQRFVRAGGGYVGVHAASDTEYDWPWYGDLVGGYFAGHPRIQEATILVADQDHPSTSMLPQRWVRTDEWYNFRANPRGKVHVLATLDESTYEGGTMGGDHPIVWCHEYDGGRAWYTALGHTNESYAEPLFREHLLGGIRWAAGRAEGDASGTKDSCYDVTVLDDDVTDPMELTVLPDGRVLFVERAGVIKLWHPDGGRTTTAGFIEVFDELEDGLLGVTQAPDFADTGHIYVFYSPADPEPLNRLSRLTLVGDEIDPASEVQMLDVATQRDECCHSGGSLAFDAHGNLYISTGDNTSPFASDGYTPIDEREGRGPFDAQKSSGNTNDLRGKVLRITPQPDGSYTIPDGNLFDDASEGRPEIYVMGCRNPFRISIDPKRDWLYWGDVGPDAGGHSDTRGPAGHDEFNQARSAGNYGWPYVIGDNLVYHDFDFETRAEGAAFDAAAPVNDSPNNTGARVLPPAIPAWIGYTYGETPAFRNLGSGGRCAMAGPVFYSDLHGGGERALPAYFDNTVFLYEWARDHLYEAKLDDNGDLLVLNRFLPSVRLRRPHDLELGPDGCLYAIEWGTAFGGGSDDAQIVRIEHYPSGNRPPKPVIDASVTDGPVPLDVVFDAFSSQSRASNPTLEYAWDLDGDGADDASGARVAYTYDAAGAHTVRLRVTDTTGLSSEATVTIVAGNTKPDVSFAWPPDGGVVTFGDVVEYRVSAHDVEDGAAPSDEVEVRTYLGHDSHAHPLRRFWGTSGVFRTMRDAGHGGDADLFTVVETNWRDGGVSSAPPLRGRDQIILQPQRKFARYSSAESGVGLGNGQDPEAGGQVAMFTSNGGWMSYGPLNLHGVETMRFRVAAGAVGGALELRMDAPDGPALGQVLVDGSGSTMLTKGPHPIRVEFFEKGGGAGLIMRVAGPGFDKRVVPARWLACDAGAGLEAKWYHLDPAVSRLPNFDELEPTATNVVPNIDWASTNGAMGSSGRPDNFGAVFEGHVFVPEDGGYTFSLESDDGSRMFVDGVEVVTNDGTHGMREISTPIRWTNVDVAVRDPGRTFDLYVVLRTDDGASTDVRLNWIDFVGPGVGVGQDETLRRPSEHDH